MAEERILVTGGSGFIGTNVIEFYCNTNVGALENFDIAPPRNPEHTAYWRDVNICDAEKLREGVMRFRPTAVIHLAARADMLGKSADDYRENTLGVSNLIAALRGLTNRPRLLVASSRMVCDIHFQPKSEIDYCPTNAYGESKVQTETITRRDCGNSIPWVLVRPTGIWGPWFDVPYRHFFRAVGRGLYVHPRGCMTKKSYGFVGNTVFQLDRLLFANFNAAQGRTFYVCDTAVSVLHWAGQIAATFGKRPPLEVPYVLMWLAAKAGDVLEAVGVRHAPLTSFRLNNLATDMCFAHMTAEEIVGPQPFLIEQGTEITCDWMSRGFSVPERGK